METSSSVDIVSAPIVPTVLPGLNAEEAPWFNPAASNIEHLFSKEIEDQVLAITREIFPGHVSIRIDDDPEHPGYRYSVIEAQASGEPTEVVGRELAWYRRIISQFPALACLRLSLSFS